MLLAGGSIPRCIHLILIPKKNNLSKPSECLCFPCMMPPQADTGPLPAKQYHRLGFSTSEMHYEFEE